MRDQTLHSSSVPVYHVCQCCNGAGCNVCADLVLIEGDIPDELGPDFDEINLDDWTDSNRLLHCSDMPINRVIGITARYVLCQDCLRALPYTDELHQTEGSCVCGGDMCGCEGCNQQVHMLLAGVRDYRVLDLLSPIADWSADHGFTAIPPFPSVRFFGPGAIDSRMPWERAHDDWLRDMEV